ncbi:hypothetical protein NMQ14_06520 [Methyloversatilis sp. XJ19-13]|uniref:hypothetical protein n=1 Tax=Methyloversatilis sp. XJ19-13 TaxID=2963430 RepID=UPI00211BCE8E|nr:hypothetical protein [Methyloversatilis sp. XJ19-13]MCQ9373902.1 hypothetical protein [Methyloversatilis sp. XJ19-13]
MRALCAVLGRDVPVVLISGDTAPDRLLQARSGEPAVPYKPMAADVLIRAIGAALNQVAVDAGADSA